MAAEPTPSTNGSAGAVPASRTWLAIGLAWLFPGAGHIVLGRARRGILFGVLVWFSFGLGLAHDGRLALRDQRQPLLTTLQVVANLGVGPADLMARLRVYGEAAYTLPAGRGGAKETPRTNIFRERERSPVASYGTAYLWTAGLMNLLLLFDVWDVGRERTS